MLRKPVNPKRVGNTTYPKKNPTPRVPRGDDVREASDNPRKKRKLNLRDTDYVKHIVIGDVNDADEILNVIGEADIYYAELDSELDEDIVANKDNLVYHFYFQGEHFASYKPSEAGFYLRDSANKILVNCLPMQAIYEHINKPIKVFKTAAVNHQKQNVVFAEWSIKDDESTFNVTNKDVFTRTTLARQIVHHSQGIVSISYNNREIAVVALNHLIVNTLNLKLSDNEDTTIKIGRALNRNFMDIGYVKTAETINFEQTVTSNTVKRDRTTEYVKGDEIIASYNGFNNVLEIYDISACQYLPKGVMKHAIVNFLADNGQIIGTINAGEFPQVTFADDVAEQVQTCVNLVLESLNRVQQVQVVAQEEIAQPPEPVIPAIDPDDHAPSEPEQENIPPTDPNVTKAPTFRSDGRNQFPHGMDVYTQLREEKQRNATLEEENEKLKAKNKKQKRELEEARSRIAKFEQSGKNPNTNPTTKRSRSA